MLPCLAAISCGAGVSAGCQDRAPGAALRASFLARQPACTCDTERSAASNCAAFAMLSVRADTAGRMISDGAWKR